MSIALQKILPVPVVAVHNQEFVPSCISGHDSRQKALEVTRKRSAAKQLGSVGVCTDL